MRLVNRIVQISLVIVFSNYLASTAGAQESADTTNQQDIDLCEAAKISTPAPLGLSDLTCEQLVEMSKPRKTTEIVVLPEETVEEIGE